MVVRMGEQHLNVDKFLVFERGSQLFHDFLSWTQSAIINTAQMGL